VAHGCRTVLAMDCVLAVAESQHGRPLNSVVRRHVKNWRNWAPLLIGGSVIYAVLCVVRR
jgi:hypothetical protein